MASKIQIQAPFIAPLRLPLIKAWWEYVTNAPEDNNNKVFNRGIAKGFKASIPWGGQLDPMATSGLRLAWKNPQNTEKNAMISLMINKVKPKIKPAWTCLVWFPKKVPSRITSLNHKTIAKAVNKNPKISKLPPFSYPWKYITAETVKVNNAKLVKIGQGEVCTKW